MYHNITTASHLLWVTRFTRLQRYHNHSQIDLISFLVFNATFSNISAITWRPVLVVEEAGVPGENQMSDEERLNIGLSIIKL
jgi:hypothetical protein